MPVCRNRHFFQLALLATLATLFRRFRSDLIFSESIFALATADDIISSHGSGPSWSG